jgi:GT2 family glycosyltransferase
MDQADEVILVDNGSPDGVVGDAGRRLGAIVESLPINTGFPWGVNVGLRRARGDLIALLNDDAVAEPGWLTSAAAVLADPGVAAVGPKILFPWPFVQVYLDEPTHFAPGDPRPLGRKIHRVEVGGLGVPLGSLIGPGVHRVENLRDGDVTHEWRWTTGSGPLYIPVPEETKGSAVSINGDSIPVVQVIDLVSNAGSYLSSQGHGGDHGFATPDDGRFDTYTECFATTGAAMVARADAFALLGAFAESFFAYYEDFDWCWRARLAGLHIVYEPAGVVRHVGGASTGGPTSDRVRYLAARNRMQTLARNAPLRVLWSQLRSPVDRPETGMALPLTKRVALGLVERRRLARVWAQRPSAVWTEWAGRGESWPDPIR